MIYRPTSVALSCPKMSKCPENLALTHRVNWRHKSMATIRSPFRGHKKVKVAHTRLPSVGFRSRSRFSAVSLQVMWIINPTVGCHYFPSGLQLPPQPLRGLLPVSLLGEQRHNGCEQFAQDCYPTASRLRFEPGPFCAWVQHANHSATEPPSVRGRLKNRTEHSPSCPRSASPSPVRFLQYDHLAILLYCSCWRLREHRIFPVWQRRMHVAVPRLRWQSTLPRRQRRTKLHFRHDGCEQFA